MDEIHLFWVVFTPIWEGGLLSTHGICLVCLGFFFFPALYEVSGEVTSSGRVWGYGWFSANKPQMGLK